MSNFEQRWKHYIRCTERALDLRLKPSDIEPARLHQAMRYVSLGGGKRFRAMLVYACGEIVKADQAQLDTPASAVEMVHAYSLTHDDLPAMDDDELRRGQPTCHLKFDEATAILAGDALQSRAMELLASPDWNSVSEEQRSRMSAQLSNAIGSEGMAGGQMLDMQATQTQVNFDQLVNIHQLKTGALIRASAKLGVLAANNVDEELLQIVDQYASALGLAFQIADDILDHTGDSETLGKPSGSDHQMNKSTYVSILGLDAARNEAEKLSQLAIETIRGLGDNRAFLEQLAHFVVTRSY